MRSRSESKQTQLDGTVRLPDGRNIPIVVNIDRKDLERAGVATADYRHGQAPPSKKDLKKQDLFKEVLTAAGPGALEAVAEEEPLLVRAVEVFGKKEKALSWLNAANPMFENKTPYDAAETADGRSKVLDILFDLEQGFPA